MNDWTEIYKAADGWRWRRKAPNYETIASGQAYRTKWGVQRAAKKLWPGEDIKEVR